jgi:hypothetical protein
MSPYLEPVKRSLMAFMAGGEFWPLWRAVMEATSAVDLSAAEETWFDALYELVYMAAPDPVSEDEQRDGLIGSAQLRAAILENNLEDQMPA